MTIARALLVSASCLALTSYTAFAQMPPSAAAPAAAPATAPAPAATDNAAPLIAAPAAGTAAPAPVHAAPAAAPAAKAPAPKADYVTRDEIPELVKKALFDNPDILIQTAQKYRDNQEAQIKEQVKDALAQYKNDLINDPNSPTVGSADADVTVVEFFDYHCGYCHQIAPVLAKLIQDDKKLRVVFKEFPILSEDSVTAAKAALAVNRIAKDKYFGYYQELMKGSGKFDEKSLIDTAKKLGINGEKLKAEMAKPEITAQLDKNREIAEALAIRGTPALIIGDELIPGAMAYEDLKKEVEKARALASTAPAAPAAKAAPAPAEAPQEKPATTNPPATPPAAVPTAP